MKTKLLLLLAIILARHSSTLGQNIEIRLSVKVIVNATSGARPTGITDVLLNTSATNTNAWMASYWRGYRYRITEIVNIGGPSQGGASGPSKWFGLDPRTPATTWQQFQSDTQNDSRYLFRSNQVNYYITMGPVSNSGGAAPIAGNPSDNGFLSCYGLVNTGPWWMVHETGHFFGLGHTFGGAVCPATSAGDDGIIDTLPEVDCWTRDQIANNSYGVPYNSLNPAQQRLVDDTFFNVMSYHNAATKDTDENRMTELQLDRYADMANSIRAATVNGRTHFVSLSGSDAGAGSSTSPYQTVTRAVTAANAAGGDIVLLRPGAYNQTLTINKSCTLRATRAGTVTIGASTALLSASTRNIFPISEDKER